MVTLRRDALCVKRLDASARPPHAARTMQLDTALSLRRSVRAFLPRDVPRETLASIFARAQQTPSWCNIQPWRVWLASGEARVRLVSGLVEAAKTRMPEPDVAHPGEYPEPYGTHRRQCGKALYEAMGVARDDGVGRQGAWMRNFVAFDAPHVAIVGIDRRFGLYAALDVGCWLQSVLLLATSEGVSTCAQAALATYPDVARKELGVGDDVQILFGIAMGYEDEQAAANACRTTRAPLDANVSFVER
ncbi:Nitroreductase NfnB [Sandaracinus amylolyticus]|nr:Nitroreductase NfnB [Sandaracinus amylolyticus]